MQKIAVLAVNYARAKATAMDCHLRQGERFFVGDMGSCRGLDNIWYIEGIHADSHPHYRHFMGYLRMLNALPFASILYYKYQIECRPDN